MVFLSFDTPFQTGLWTHEEAVNYFGGKGANIRKMVGELGISVPEGFTIPTTCNYEMVEKFPVSLNEAVEKLEIQTGRNFGKTTKPLLVSVRSGAPRSMPGMMETVLNLGLNDKTVESLAKETNPRFAWDSYRRFIQMYSTTVNGIPAKEFSEVYDVAVNFFGKLGPNEKVLRRIVDKFKTICDTHNKPVPSNVNEQLLGAIKAVFDSWTSEKAHAYREIEGISHDLGTAVNIQRMVFGNLNDNSGTGVAFTRDPNTGENTIYGDFLVNAQGEDVVAGTHKTVPIADMGKHFPEQTAGLYDIIDKLEAEYKDMCDIEFTIEDGKLYMLQTRVGKRSSAASVRIAVEMLTEKLIDSETAIDRLSAIETTQKQDAGIFNGVLIGTGKPASGDMVVGQAVFNKEDAVSFTENGIDVILVREETSPDDISGMAAAVGILTMNGGLVSHAAVVARAWGKTCVVGCSDITSIDSQTAIIGGQAFSTGDKIAINGSTGEVFVGKD